MFRIGIILLKEFHSSFHTETININFVIALDISITWSCGSCILQRITNGNSISQQVWIECKASFGQQEMQTAQALPESMDLFTFLCAKQCQRHKNLSKNTISTLQNSSLSPKIFLGIINARKLSKVLSSIGEALIMRVWKMRRALQGGSNRRA